jgi:hypothetical protein
MLSLRELFVERDLLGKPVATFPVHARIYFGKTAWNTDFAADNTSSATLVCSRLGGSMASARRSRGRETSGISAGGVGR